MLKPSQRSHWWTKGGVYTGAVEAKAPQSRLLAVTLQPLELGERKEGVAPKHQTLQFRPDDDPNGLQRNTTTVASKHLWSPLIIGS